MMTKIEIFDDIHRPKKTNQTVVKGKRTKRPRPTSSTSSSGGDQSFNNNSLFTPSNSQSPTSSSTCTITDQEDEDMANCLILLAHGGGNQKSKQDYNKKATLRSTNRKFTELTTSDAKVGIYVYECKTCNRSFPSFQALGGHRASHKKPKQDNLNGIDDHLKCLGTKKSSVTSATSKDIPPRPGRDQVLVVKKNRVDKEEKANKVHECSICGSEFGSGQALGGHMRRHRSALNNKGTTSLDITSTVHDSSSHDVCDEKPRNNNLLSLDLNLPAPAEDEVFLLGVNGGLQLSV